MFGKPSTEWRRMFLEDENWMRLNILYLAVFLVIINANAVLGIKVESPQELKFSLEKPPLNPGSFCVTEDELFIIPDNNEGYLKIYNNNGEFLELVGIIGKKGYGHDEFVKPIDCCYDEASSSPSFLVTLHETL